jgi:UDP-N-acetylmuramyl pentapeptide synthase
MLELGEYSEQKHLEMIHLANEFDWRFIITVGKEFAKIKHNGLHFQNVEDLKAWFWKQNFKDHTFLLKGSRGIKLELLLQ